MSNRPKNVNIQLKNHRKNRRKRRKNLHHLDVRMIHQTDHHGIEAVRQDVEVVDRDEVNFIQKKLYSFYSLIFLLK